MRRLLGPGDPITMARTHKTAHIKAQMVERARQEEEARRKVVCARIRSQ
ncbi:hypothetical protein PF008_g21131 [Phytophthora fragariae]|uniref:Uncharacterized protein n=1 Tax=Phytophthora fragariae TaxID=53985 RepID=A0A6G0QXF5_9STRA|nr:hypothetical protein PF008_g21131 [Phytophthora fragariae]